MAEQDTETGQSTGRISRVTGKRPLTRAEAARHASLVRWGKENPFAARLAAIREKKKGGKGKGKAAAKPKKTPEQRLAERQQKRAEARQSVVQAMAEQDAGLQPAAANALLGFADGGSIDPKFAPGLASVGLVEGDPPRLSDAGRAAVAAMNRGDVRGAIDAVGRGTERTGKQAEREKAKTEREATRQQKQAEREKAKVEREQERAAREKERAKAGGGGSKKEPREPAENNRDEADATIRRSEALPKNGPKGSALAALDTLREGGDADPKETQALVERGLVEGRPGGGLRLSTAGRRFLRALDSGNAENAQIALDDAEDRVARRKQRNDERERRDAERENDRLQREADRQADNERRKADQETRTNARRRIMLERVSARKAIEDTPMSDLSPILDELDDIATELQELGLDDAEIKAGRRHSGSDQAIIQAMYDRCQELCEMCEALGAETGDEGGGEDEETARGHIQQAIDLHQAHMNGSEPTDEDSQQQLMDHLTAAMSALEGEMDMEGKAQRTFGGKERAELDDADFAGPGRTYPIMTAQDVRDAARLIGKADDPEAVKRRIIAIARRKGFADAIPDAWQSETKKSVDEACFTMGDAIKLLEDGRVGGLAVRFGSEDEHDLSPMRDYFTKSTEFWIDKFGWPRPILYHHALDNDTRDDPVIGEWTKATVTDEGVWLEGQLNRSYRYHNAIKELIKRGALKLSSDSAPHLVIRERKPSGAHEVKRWPLITASTTTEPAEPRLTAISFKALLAELGLNDIDQDDPEAQAIDSERPDGAKVLDERARRMTLELDLLALE